MINKNYCINFNHGRILVSIQYCPDCGERFNVATESKNCTEKGHFERAKKYIYCCDCGVALSGKAKKPFPLI